MMKVLLLYRQRDWSLSHWRKPERSILIENSDVMDCEGTSQAPSSGSLLLLLILSASLFHPPSSLRVPIPLFFFSFFLSLSFFYVLAGYSFYSFGITELKPNSSLARSRRGAAVYPELSAAACVLPAASPPVYTLHLSISMLYAPPPFLLHLPQC